ANVKWESEMSFLFPNQNITQQLLETKPKHIQNIVTSTLFQSLKDWLNPLSLSQACYSYHILKNECKLICKYPSDVTLEGHCVVKLADNNNEITLLSFGGNTNIRHTLVMKYVSVWSNDNEINKSKKLNNYNKWVPFTDNHNNRIHTGRDRLLYWNACDDWWKQQSFVIITYYYYISVFNLNTFQFIKHDRLPTDNWICITALMILFCEKTGLSIDYDEDDNTFQFCKLPVCDDIAPFFRYAYVFVNDTILFFGGWNGKFGDKKIASKAVHKYSIRKNKWKIFQNTLLRPLFVFFWFCFVYIRYIPKSNKIQEKYLKMDEMVESKRTKR
ncbi:hypothetical protein RFI_30735, partial [Reticulomyxa filosa]